jgi:hypothetical protein
MQHRHRAPCRRSSPAICQPSFEDAAHSWRSSRFQLQPSPAVPCRRLLRGIHPQFAIGRLAQRGHGAGWGPFFRAEGKKGAVFPSPQTLCRAHPQRAVRCLKQRSNISARNSGLRILVQNQKRNAIEPHQARLGAEPQKPIAGLHQRMHAVLRKPVFHPPGLAAVIAQRRRRLKGQGRTASRHQHGGEEPGTTSRVSALFVRSRVGSRGVQNNVRDTPTRVLLGCSLAYHPQ